MIKIREPIVEGIFYPSDEKHAHKLIQRLIASSLKGAGDAFAIMSPHAGYRYAGPIAAAAFLAAANRNINTVVILAPVHRDPQDEIYFPESEGFRTPLGLLPVNHSLIDELCQCSNKFYKNDIPHLEEHCIEVQLPFIQYLFPDAQIVPILLGKTNLKNVTLLANALQLTFAKHYADTLFIISANLTSYIRGKNAKKEADTFLHLIKEGDYKGIISAYEKKIISSCGAGCVATLLAFQNMVFVANIISCGSSADTNANYSELVHYAAISFYLQRVKENAI